MEDKKWCQEQRGRAMWEEVEEPLLEVAAEEQN